MRQIQGIIAGLLVCIAIGLVSCSSSSVTAKNDQARLIKGKVENKNYIINVNRMIPMNGKSRQLTTNYSLTIKGDSVSSYLPYFGRAYSIPYGGGTGLNFDAPLTNYTVSFDNKGTADITFQTRSEDDVYRFNMHVFTNGSTSILVTPNNRQAISFYGKMNLMAEVE